MSDAETPPDGVPGSPRDAVADAADGSPAAGSVAPPRSVREVEVERDRWKARGLDAERRYRERELALRRLREDVEDLRRDRDAWRDQAERLGGASAEATGAQRHEAKPDSDRVRAAAKRTIRAAWEIMPEPGRRLARPLVQRMRARSSGAPAGTGAGGAGVNGALPPPERQLVVRSMQETGPQIETIEAIEAVDADRYSRQFSGPFSGQPGAGPRVVTEPVSVVIPTLNGGPGFARALDAIRRQEGVADVELLVVDSGSTDGTQELARSRGAQVVEIPPEEFSHGGTRDRMAELARGEILLMTVQDAVLAGPHALRDLVAHLVSDPLLAAVSARQVPRLDCDLFGAFIMFAHARATLAIPATRDTAWFPLLTLSEKRAFCAVDNVCAVIRRDAWESLRFRDVAFAEDLDFGLRAVEQGWRIATATDVSVVHSHNRSARYHLGRFLVDRLTVAAFLGDPDRNPASLAGLEGVAAASLELLGQVEAARVAARGPRLVPFVPLVPYLESVAAVLGVPDAAAGPEGPSGELAEIVDLLATGEAGPPSSRDPAVTGLLRDGLVDLLHAPILKEFAGRHPYVEAEEAEVFIGRAASLVIGAVLGDAMRDTIPDTPLANRLRQGI
jgi:GT2 family glycosyltransferase